MVTQERAKATRDAIVRGAAEVFNRCGYAISTQLAIAQEAGVTKGALQFHFVSKEELAHAVINEQHRISRRAAEGVMAESPGALETMILLCLMLARQLVTEPIVSAGIRLTMEAPSFQVPVTTPYEDWLVTYENLIRQGIGEGSILEDTDPAALSRFIVGSFTGVQLLSDALEKRCDLARRATEMWQILLPAILAPGAQIDLHRLSGIVIASQPDPARELISSD